MVGRAGLVGELIDLARATTDGLGAVVLLTGEAGIGKTTVARVLAREVADTVAVTWGRCTADRAAPPFGPWAGAVDLDAVEVTDPEVVDPAIGAPRLERLNVLRDRLLGARPARVHIIEDLQWADVASVLLLAHVAPALVDEPLLVIGTLRSGEPLGAPLEGALDQVQQHAIVLPVPPLPDDAIDHLIDDAGWGHDPDVVAVVASRTGGNPLFVTELLRAARLDEHGDRLRAVVEHGVPGRVVELVAHRLTRLPDPVADLVVSAAVLGADGDVRTLAAMDDVDVESLVDLLEQARAARVLDTAQPGRWRFGHDLVRDAVYRSAPDATRARKHAAALDALADDPTSSPAVLAHHALAALPLLDGERAVALAARAGEAAFALHAYEEAVEWFRRALEAATHDVAPRWRAQLLVRTGEAHRQLGELEAARRSFVEAAGLTDDAELLARAAMGYADPGADLGIAYRTDDATTTALLERAIAAQPAQDASTTAMLEARLAAELYFSDHPGDARSLADSALARARRLGDRRALAAASAVVHDAFVVGQTDLDVQLAGSAALLEWADETRSPAASLTAHRARVFDLLAAGDLAGVDSEVLAFRRIAEPLQVPSYQWWPALWSAMRALLEGRHDVAEERALAAFRLGERPFPSLAFMNLSFLLFFLRREQGRLAEMEEATREHAATHADIPAIRVALTFLLAETGRIDEAGGMLRGLTVADLRGLHDRNWPASWFQLARATALVGDERLARMLVDDTRRPSERCVTVSLATVCLGAVDLATGWLLETVGDLDGAAAAYLAAAETNARIGARSWLAQSRADRARVLIRRGADLDRAEVARLVELAAGAVEAIGLTALGAQVDRLRQVVGPSSPSSETIRAPAGASVRREGPVWLLDFAGRRAQVAHRRGMDDLAFLLARPEQSVSALELLGDTATPSSVVRGAPTLDERARREVRDRLRELDAEVDDAEADGDGERAALAREQRQLLAEAVARDLGLGGKARRIDDPIERARKTVSTRIRRTISAVGQAHPELGRHLERSIDTGAWCAYRPAEPVTWTS